MDKNFPKGSIAPDIAADLMQDSFDLVAAIRQHVGGVLGELNITEALADALWSFDPDGRTISRRDLAARLRCDPSNATLLADRLEARGYIERSSDLQDRRFKAMRLTSAGVAARARILSAVATGPPFTRLSDPELRQFAELLRRLVDSPAALVGDDSTGARSVPKPACRSPAQPRQP